MNYKDLNDYEMVYRIRENDDFATNDLFKKYEPVIIGIAKKYYPYAKKQGVDMDDLVQEGRIAVGKAVATYDLDGDNLFYTYVTVCIKRQMITFCRNLNRKKHMPLNYSLDDECLYTIGDMTFEPNTYLVERCDEERFIKCKNSFKLLDSSIFELRYNGFSYREISELLDVSFSYVDSHLCKIRKSLQVMKDKF